MFERNQDSESARNTSIPWSSLFYSSKLAPLGNPSRRLLDVPLCKSMTRCMRSDGMNGFKNLVHSESESVLTRVYDISICSHYRRCADYTSHAACSNWCKPTSAEIDFFPLGFRTPAMKRLVIFLPAQWAFLALSLCGPQTALEKIVWIPCSRVHRACHDGKNGLFITPSKHKKTRAFLKCSLGLYSQYWL